MKPNRPHFPCQTEDGRTFVMKGTKIVQEIPGWETTERWRIAQRIADQRNREHAATAFTPRDWIALACVAIMTAPVAADVATGGRFSAAVVAWIMP